MVDAVQRAYDAIRQRINTGEYAAGAHLKGEDLAANFGISRTPVREALRRLNSEGLVEFIPNRGASVVAWTRADVDEVFGLRVVLESHAASLAAQRLQESQIEELDRLAKITARLAASDALGERAEIATANSRLHRLIYAAAAHPRLAAMAASVVQVPLVMQTLHAYTRADLVRSASHHLELVAAFRVRDGDWAASVMRCHLRAAHHVFLRERAAVGGVSDAPEANQTRRRGR